jgi:filamentous hemagglutinin family protein
MKSRHAVREFTDSRYLSLVCFLVLPVLLTIGLASAAHAAPEGGVVRAGNAQIIGQGGTTLIEQSSPRAIIDWRSFGIQSSEQVRFAQPSVSAATLNRITGDQVSLILGKMDANGQILLINPNGIIFGKGAQINVGSLIAGTANITNDNFLAGKLVFDQPGRPGAGVMNAGSITAAEGGLVALIAPHVRNDGLIQARLGKVVLGAADTFTLDLYGDGLVNLALNEESLAQLKDAQGQPIKELIRQTGTIDVGGGQAVLVTAEAAKGMLDSLINMSGTILADSAVQAGGRIELLARGGSVDVSGHLSAKGTTGGQIDVLGNRVHLFSTAKLDVGGNYSGGTLHIGGAYQGGGDTYRAQRTQIDAGAILQANAQSRGSGGDVVVWSDGETAYAGRIEARGGVESGDGGRVEVSGKRMLSYSGHVDAGASRGNAGTLLLDPYNFTIGMAEAALISRVLRTGTSTAVSADNDLIVNDMIDGRGRLAGGELSLTAGNNLNVNDHILTNNGRINLFATAGAINMASGKVVYAGAAPIMARSGGTLTSAAYLMGGRLSLVSTQGSVHVNQGIDRGIENVWIQAGEDVNINAPIVSLSNGDTVNIEAGNDINVNDQIDGRPALGSHPNGAVNLTAGQDIGLNKSILAGSINLTAARGTINASTMTAGTVTLDANGIPQGEGLFAGGGPISATAGGNLSSGIYVTTGPVSIRSTGGNVTIDTKLAEILGPVTVKSDTGSVNIDQEIANIRSGSSLSIAAGTDINLNKQLNALDDSNPLSIAPVPGGSVTFAAGNNITLNRDLVANNGAIHLVAAEGKINLASGTLVHAGAAPITMNSRRDLDNASYLLGDSLSLTSTQGSVFINQGIDRSNGNLLIQAAEDVHINQPIISLSDGNSVDIRAGNNIHVNAQIDGRPALGSHPNGSVAMNVYQNIYLHKSILAGSIDLIASEGTIYAPTMTAGQVTLDASGIPHGDGLFTGTGPISVTAGDHLSTGIYVTTGPVSIRSTRGDINVSTKLAEILGDVTLTSDLASVNIDQEIANIRSGSSLMITAGTDIHMNRQIDALDDTNPLSITPIPGGRVALTAANHVNLNRDLGTFNGPVDITAASGALNIGWDTPDNRTYRIQTGTAPIAVTTGGNLSTGPAPPTAFYWDPTWIDGMTVTEAGEFKETYIIDQLKRYVAFSTTGKLSLTSTGSDITVDAPIPDTTGEVALTAAEAIAVHHKVFSNNQPIALTAGAGGIMISDMNDTYGFGVGITPMIDSGSAPLTLRAVGDISVSTVNGIATTGKLTIDTDGKILQGLVNQNWEGKPSEIELIADQGIDSFFAGYSPKISATSSDGAIHLDVDRPGQLIINAPSPTAGDVFTGGFMGSDVKINAGRDIHLTDVYESGIIALRAGRNAHLGAFNDIASLDVAAGGDVHFSGGHFNQPPYATIWIDGGDLSVTSTGGNISFGSAADYSAIHIGHGESLALNAYGSVELGILQTQGPVSITAQTGNITLRNDIGPPIQFYNPTSDTWYSTFNEAGLLGLYGGSAYTEGAPAFDSTGHGVASLVLSAGGHIMMQGAKAVGSVDITAGGVLTPAYGIFSGAPDGVHIIAGGGALEKKSGGDINHAGPYAFSGASFGDITLGNQRQLRMAPPSVPAISPGPSVAPPVSPLALTALPAQPPDAAVLAAQEPGALTALPAQPPDIANVSGSIPAASGTGMPEQDIDPQRAAGTSELTEIVPEESEEEDERKKVVKFSGGKGISREADFGRR